MSKLLISFSILFFSGLSFAFTYPACESAEKDWHRAKFAKEVTELLSAKADTGHVALYELLERLRSSPYYSLSIDTLAARIEGLCLLPMYKEGIETIVPAMVCHSDFVVAEVDCAVRVFERGRPAVPTE